MGKQVIVIRLYSYHHRDVDVAVREIIKSVKMSGAGVIGPVPMPNNVRSIVLPRSPHVYEDSKEKFQIVTHTRMVKIVDANPRTVNALMNLELFSGVGVEVKLYDR